MYTPIPIHDKKSFMKWFLRHFTLKKLEATWLLNYLMKRDKLLSKVSFVNDARFCPRAIIISSNCSDGIPFLFYKQQIVTDDIDKLFHDIHLHQDEDIYIQLNFKQANQNPFYAGVLEENPFAPKETSMSLHDQDAAKHLLENLLQEYQLKKLKEDIDQALDEKNEAKFKKLVVELNKLKIANNVFLDEGLSNEMRWIKNDLERYVGAKEYIDTLLVPLLPFEFSNDTNLAKNAFQIEVLSIFINELEKEFTGRVVLSPHYHYLKSSKKEVEIERLNDWVVDAKKQPFEHVFFVTFDATWKKEEKTMDGTLLWLPVTHSGDIQSKETATIIRDQVEQVSELIRSYW